MMDSGNKKKHAKELNERQARSAKCTEMEKVLPRREAVIAFRRKPYSTMTGGDYNELGR